MINRISYYGQLMFSRRKMSECCAKLLMGENFVRKSTKERFSHIAFALSFTGFKKKNTYVLSYINTLKQLSLKFTSLQLIRNLLSLSQILNGLYIRFLVPALQKEEQ